MNCHEKLNRQPEPPEGGRRAAELDAPLDAVVTPDAARLADAARAGLGAGPDGERWVAELGARLDAEPTLDEPVVRNAAADVLRRRADARFERPGTAEEIWNRVRRSAPGIERRSDADTFFVDAYLFTSAVIDRYRAGEGYWATGREHLFPVRPEPFGFAGWIASNIDGVAKRIRRGEEVGVASTAGRKLKFIPYDPANLTEAPDSRTGPSSQEWESDHPLDELIACALQAATSSERVLSYDLLRRPAAERDRTARPVRAAAIAAINALSKAATLLPSLGPDGVKDFMASPDRLSGAAIRATDGRERTPDALDQHVKRTKPHVVFAVSAALETANEQTGPSANQDAGHVWDLTTWCWRAAQLPQLSSMLRTAVRNRASAELTAALDTWSTQLAETCRHPMRHRIVHDCLATATAEALEKAQEIIAIHTPGPPGPARAALVAHAQRLVDLQNSLPSRHNPPMVAPPTTDIQGNFT